MTMTIWQGAITIVTVVLGNMLLSIAGGTIVYMLLVQLVF